MAQLTPEKRARVEARTHELHREYLVLQQLYEKLNLLQGETLAQKEEQASAKLGYSSGERQLTLEALSEVVTNLGGELEITVKLPGIEAIRLTGNEDFLFAPS